VTNICRLRRAQPWVLAQRGPTLNQKPEITHGPRCRQHSAAPEVVPGLAELVGALAGRLYRRGAKLPPPRARLLRAHRTSIPRRGTAATRGSDVYLLQGNDEAAINHLEKGLVAGTADLGQRAAGTAPMPI